MLIFYNGTQCEIEEVYFTNGRYANSGFNICKEYLLSKVYGHISNIRTVFNLKWPPLILMDKL